MDFMTDIFGQDAGMVLRLIQIIVTILLGVVGWLIVYTLNRVNRTIDAAMETLNDHERRVARLEGWQAATNYGIRPTARP